MDPVAEAAERAEPAVVRNEIVIALVGVTDAEFDAICARACLEIRACLKIVCRRTGRDRGPHRCGRRYSGGRPTSADGGRDRNRKHGHLRLARANGAQRRPHGSAACDPAGDRDALRAPSSSAPTVSSMATSGRWATRVIAQLARHRAGAIRAERPSGYRLSQKRLRLASRCHDAATSRRCPRSRLASQRPTGVVADSVGSVRPSRANRSRARLRPPRNGHRVRQDIGLPPSIASLRQAIGELAVDPRMEPPQQILAAPKQLQKLRTMRAVLKGCAGQASRGSQGSPRGAARPAEARSSRRSGRPIRASWRACAEERAAPLRYGTSADWRRRAAED